MDKTYALICVMSFAVFIIGTIINIAKYKELKRMLENIDFQQSKIDFRLFVVEKKQNIFQEKKIG